jgi:predicted small metal-binding protein
VPNDSGGRPLLAKGEKNRKPGFFRRVRDPGQKGHPEGKDVRVHGRTICVAYAGVYLYRVVPALRELPTSTESGVVAVIPKKNLTCPCGVGIRGTDEDDLVEKVQQHLKELHPGHDYSRDEILFMAY